LSRFRQREILFKGLLWEEDASDPLQIPIAVQVKTPLWNSLGRALILKNSAPVVIFATLMIATRDTLLAEFHEIWNPSSRYCGKLLRLFLGVWHYSVGLSNSSVIFLGPPSIQLRGTGHLFFGQLLRGYREPRDIGYLSQEQVRENITRSITAFHGTLAYSVGQWNCEHWARLVTTGDPVSHQVGGIPFGVAQKLGGYFRHPSAARVLAEA
jgi:hypothetical protein